MSDMHPHHKARLPSDYADNSVAHQTFRPHPKVAHLTGGYRTTTVRKDTKIGRGILPRTGAFCPTLRSVAFCPM